jgi:hypothetical protein
MNKVAIQGSPLLQGIWLAWRKVCEGLTQEEPKDKNEMFRQPLFGNSKICKQDGTPWGMEPGSKFSLWATRGIQCLENLWREIGGRV